MKKSPWFLLAFLFCVTAFLVLLKPSPPQKVILTRYKVPECLNYPLKKYIFLQANLQGNPLEEQVNQAYQRFKDQLVDINVSKKRLSLEKQKKPENKEKFPPSIPFKIPVQGNIIFLEQEKTNSYYTKVVIETDYAAEVFSPTYGVVNYIGPLGSLGCVLIIDYGEGDHNVLSGFEALYVTVGQVIYAGEIIGKMPGYGVNKPRLTFEFPFH